MNFVSMKKEPDGALEISIDGVGVEVDIGPETNHRLFLGGGGGTIEKKEKDKKKQNGCVVFRQ